MTNTTSPVLNSPRIVNTVEDGIASLRLSRKKRNGLAIRSALFTLSLGARFVVDAIYDWFNFSSNSLQSQASYALHFLPKLKCFTNSVLARKEMELLRN